MIDTPLADKIVTKVVDACSFLNPTAKHVKIGIGRWSSRLGDFYHLNLAEDLKALALAHNVYNGQQRYFGYVFKVLRKFIWANRAIANAPMACSSGAHTGCATTPSAG